MAKLRSICWTRRNAALASSYSKLWRAVTPAWNSVCAVGVARAPELGACANRANKITHRTPRARTRCVIARIIFAPRRTQYPKNRRVTIHKYLACKPRSEPRKLRQLTYRLEKILARFSADAFGEGGYVLIVELIPEAALCLPSQCGGPQIPRYWRKEIGRASCRER